MPLHRGKSKKVISENIREMMASGHDQKQSVAASLSNAKKSIKGLGGYNPQGLAHPKKKKKTFAEALRKK
jgi:hypothetical protein